MTVVIIKQNIEKEKESRGRVTRADGDGASLNIKYLAALLMCFLVRIN